MASNLMAFESPLFSTLHDLLDSSVYAEESPIAPTRNCVRDANAIAKTPVDVKEYPNSYAFVADLPGLKSGDIKVQVEEGNVLMISGERKKEKEEEKELELGVEYLKLERRVGKFMRKFVLPDDANADAVSAVCQDGVLTVNVEKLPPPETKKPRIIEVKIA